MRPKTIHLMAAILFIFILSNSNLKPAIQKNIFLKKWEIGIAIGLDIPFLSTLYQTNYSPLFKFSGIDSYESAASQVLNIDPKKDSGMGFTVQVNHLISKKIGIQLLGEYHKTSLGGTDNSFYSFLQYTDYLYPSFKPITYTIEKYDSWPDSEGMLKQYTICLNFLSRFNLGNRVNLDFSGGPGLFFLQGDASNIGYLYWSTSHFIRVEFSYPMDFSFKSSMKLGLNLGGEISIPFLLQSDFFFSIRYFYSSSIVSELNLKDLEPYTKEHLTEIITVMNLEPITINPSFIIFTSGIKIRF